MALTRPILVVEDDEALRQVLAKQLLASGLFHPVEAATLAEASQQNGSLDARLDAILLGACLSN